MAYVTMCFDKYQSKINRNRISEKSLILLAVLFGSIGIFCGMQAPIYHKAGKAKFKILIPFLLLMQFFILLYLYLNFL